MARKVVTVVGAGSVRCAPPVLSSVAAPRFERPIELRLYDANAERLDLMARLAERLFEIARVEHEVQSTDSLDEAVRGSDAVVVCLYEDCARRMTGKTTARVLLQTDPVDGDKIIELHRGDLNQPTPFDELSPMTLAALSTPEGGDVTREQAIEGAVAMVVERTGDVPLLNLTRGAAFPSSPMTKSAEWPPTLDADEHSSRPHRILRWINGDPELGDYMESFRDSPAAQWLIADVGAL
jgi:hypothetical protein